VYVCVCECLYKCKQWYGGKREEVVRGKNS
jgi:hypothetical protein